MLITLAVIGVVAVITVPVLMNHYNDKEYVTRYQKAKAVITNGYKLMMAHYGVFDIRNLPVWSCEDEACYAKEHSQVFKIVADSTSGLDKNNLAKEYFKSEAALSLFAMPAYAADDKANFSWNDIGYIFQTPDGILVGVDYDSAERNISFYVDTNGNTKPNRVKKDLYKFLASPTGVLADVSGDLDGLKCSLEDLSGCSKEECNDFNTVVSGYNISASAQTESAYTVYANGCYKS